MRERKTGGEGGIDGRPAGALAEGVRAGREVPDELARLAVPPQRQEEADALRHGRRVERQRDRPEPHAHRDDRDRPAPYVRMRGETLERRRG